MELNIEAAPFLPHSKTMLFIEQINSCQQDGGSVTATIKEDCIFANTNGEVDEILVTELLAQGYAALEGYRSSQGNNPVKKGFLVAVKKLTYDSKSVIKVGTTLTINLQLETEIDDYTIVVGEVRMDNKIIASSHLTLYLASDSDA